MSTSRQPAPPQSQLRTIRIKRGLTQIELGGLAGMHRNTIRKLETGTTREVTAAHAEALAAALKTPVADLGLRVRAVTEARSIRIRQLSPEQRLMIDEVLSLPPEAYPLLRAAIEQVRRKLAKKPPEK